MSDPPALRGAEGSAEGTVEGPSDGALVAAALTGDGAAFRRLVERHQEPIHTYLYRLLLRDAETARDLTQSVFLKAYRNLNAVDQERPLLPWLYRIAHNEAANHLRTRARHPETAMEPEDWARVADPAGTNPEEVLAERQEREAWDAALHSALAGLKPNVRSALVLHYFEERSYQEIAEALEVPIGTVGTLIHRGRKALQRTLGDGPGAGPPPGREGP